MFSACLMRLITTYSGLKLQAIINTQIGEKNCLEWGNGISEEEYFNEIQSIHAIHERLINEPHFIVGELYFSWIKSLIINFTSTLEYYLKDSMRLNMMRNYSLFKKILAETKQAINPIDIVEINDIEQLRLKYICNISEHICSGEMWKEKLKKYVNLLSLPKHLAGEKINNKVDSIWKVRNDIAHANTRGILLNYDKNTYMYGPNISVEEYTQFALLFIKLVDEVIAFLSKVDKLTLEAWEATDATLLKNNRQRRVSFSSDTNQKGISQKI